MFSEFVICCYDIQIRFYLLLVLKSNQVIFVATQFFWFVKNHCNCFSNALYHKFSSNATILTKIIQICGTRSSVARAGWAFKASCTLSGVKYANTIVSFQTHEIRLPIHLWWSLSPTWSSPTAYRNRCCRLITRHTRSNQVILSVSLCHLASIFMLPKWLSYGTFGVALHVL